jgi:hypothetical protein
MAGGWGLTLFLRRGMVAWMRAWPPEPSRPSDRSEELLKWIPVSDEKESPEGVFPPCLYRSVATLLTDMILEARQEVLP